MLKEHVHKSNLTPGQWAYTGVRTRKNLGENGAKAGIVSEGVAQVIEDKGNTRHCRKGARETVRSSVLLFTAHHVALSLQLGQSPNQLGREEA
jgi:hypothetical protein